MSEKNPDLYREQHDSIREEFRRQAPGWGKDEVSPELRWLVGLLEPDARSSVLDVAAGTGLLSRAISPLVGSVTASDITPEMLEEGRKAAEREGISNVTFEQAMVEDLPYEDAAFDIVMTRFTPHHFQDASAAIGEMVRVLRPGGKLLVADIVSPEDEAVAARYNELESLRDTTHTRALSHSEMESTISSLGITITDSHRYEAEMSLEAWLQKTRTPPGSGRKITESIDLDLAGSKGYSATGMKPFMREGERMFRHTISAFVGEKR